MRKISFQAILTVELYHTSESGISKLRSVGVWYMLACLVDSVTVQLKELIHALFFS